MHRYDIIKLAMVSFCIFWAAPPRCQHTMPGLRGGRAIRYNAAPRTRPPLAGFPLLSLPRIEISEVLDVKGMN